MIDGRNALDPADDPCRPDSLYEDSGGRDGGVTRAGR